MSDNINVNRGFLGKIIRYSLFLIIIFGVFIVPVNMAGSDQPDIVDIGKELPQMSKDGQKIFESWYRGIDLTYVPDNNNPLDSRYNFWSNVTEIKSGFELLKLISNLNPNFPSLYDKFLFGNNISTNIILKNILNSRADQKDIWFGDFDTSIDAITIINEIGAQNKTISEIDKDNIDPEAWKVQWLEPAQNIQDLVKEVGYTIERHENPFLRKKQYKNGKNGKNTKK